MAQTVELKAIINAKDEAASAIKSFSDNIKDAKNSVAELAEGIALGQLAYDAFKKVISEATELVKESISAATEAESSDIKVNAILQTMNTSLNEQADLFATVSERAIQLGFDDETAAESMARLWQVTGDTNIAQEALATAMDVARYKGIDLESATQALILAFGGSSRMLTQLGIDLEDNASKTEILGAIQEKTGGMAEAMADSTEGAMDRMDEAIENTKESLGAIFLPVVESVANFLAENLQPTIESIIESFKKWWDKLEELGIIQYFQDAWEEIITLFNDALLPTLKEHKDLFKDIEKILGTTLIVAIATFVEAIKIAIAIITQIIDWIGDLKNATDEYREILINLTNQISEFVTKAIEWGQNLIGNFIQGIKNGINNLWAEIDTIISSITEKLGFSKNPNLATEVWGEEMIKNFAEGIKKGQIDIGEALAGVKDEVAATFTEYFGYVNSGGIVTSQGIKKFQIGGIVPGTGSTDTVPALLTPGEIVLNPRRGQGLGNIIVNFNNPVVRNDNDLETIVDTVKRTLSRDLILENLGV